MFRIFVLLLFLFLYTKQIIRLNIIEEAIKKGIYLINKQLYEGDFNMVKHNINHQVKWQNERARVSSIKMACEIILMSIIISFMIEIFMILN